ncbi:unnamed protein product [Rotaria sp. Silwood1]|nr:unnamed protein product [Rotaria sp. Silwood1]
MILFMLGSEDDCAQEVHILSSIGDENDVEISGTNETINTSEVQVHEQALHDRVCNNKGNDYIRMYQNLNNLFLLL